MLDVFKMKKLGIFAGGVLFGTAGMKREQQKKQLWSRKQKK